MIHLIYRELIVQTINSNKLRINDSGENEMLELTKIIIQKQNQLNSFFKIGNFKKIVITKQNEKT